MIKTLREMLADMSVGETLSFPIEREKTLRSTTSKLKRIYGVPFKCSVSGHEVKVTRLPADILNVALTDDVMRRSGFTLNQTPNHRKNWEWRSEGVEISVNIARKRVLFSVHRENGAHDYGSMRIGTTGELQTLFELLELDIYLKL